MSYLEARPPDVPSNSPIAVAHTGGAGPTYQVRAIVFAGDDAAYKTGVVGGEPMKA